jgi:protein-glutamine gamma-glutamyltransferase
MILLHRRLAALLGLIALLAFISGAGLDAPSVVPAAVVLLFAVFRQPGEGTARYVEPLWRAAALVLAARAGLAAVTGTGDPVLPMVDLLLLLLGAESLRPRDGSGDARHFALTFALLIASAAYRPGPLFGMLFVAYVVCATVVLVVGHLAREARHYDMTAPAPKPRFLLRIAMLSTVVLVVSGAVFLFFPRVSQGWASRTPTGLARAMVGFSDRVSIGEHGTRIEANPEIVMRVEFPGGTPASLRSLHWRGRSYNRFDGTAWSRVERSGTRLHEADVWPGPLVEQVVYARRLGEANVLFGLHPILDVTALSRIRPIRMSGGDFLYTGDVEPVYRVRSRLAPPDPDLLRRVDPEHTPEVMAHLQLPAMTARMMRLADSLRLSAPTMYDHAVAVERYLRTQFDYSLDLPPTRREATLDHFLFVRRAGHCEYFSTAMALLLRAGGVATRNVNGFLGGEWNEFGQYLTVTQNNAHSWVEVFFPGHGWVTFDPTPPGAALGIARGASTLGSLRMFLDGLDHRWSKWILDYDLGRQVSLLQRISQPFTHTPEAAARVDQQRRSPWPFIAGALLLGVMLLWLSRWQQRGTGTHQLPARIYLRMRRAYQHAGFPAAHALPPLAFAGRLGDAPGAAAARRVVDLYVRARFGGELLDADLIRELEASAAAAGRAVRTKKPG